MDYYFRGGNLPIINDYLNEECPQSLDFKLLKEDLKKKIISRTNKCKNCSKENKEIELERNYIVIEGFLLFITDIVDQFDLSIFLG